METGGHSLKAVFFKRAYREPEGSDVLAEFIRQHGFVLHETVSLRKVEASELERAGVLVIYCCDDVDFGLNMLCVHEVRLKGLSADDLPIILVIANDLYRLYKHNTLVLSFIHNREMGIDVITDLDTAIKKVLPVMLERMKESAT